VEEGHSEDGNHPTDECNYDDADHDGHGASTDSGQELATNNATDGTVSNHDNHVEDAGKLCWPVAHEIPSANLRRN